MKAETNATTKKRKPKPARLKPTGRPTKMNDTVCADICSNIELGMPYKYACEAAGISYPTFLSWKAKGELALKEKSPSKYSAAESNCVNFLEQVHKSEAEGVQHNLRKIREIGEGMGEHKPDWKALAWILKCRDPEHFSETQKIDQKTEHSGGVSINLQMTDCSKKEE